MSAWVAVILAGVGSFALRFVLLAIVGRDSMPTALEQVSGLVVPASFAGLCALQLVRPAIDGSAGSLVIAAPTTAVVATRWGRSTAVLCGMGVIWAADLVGRLL